MFAKIIFKDYKSHQYDHQQAKKQNIDQSISMGESSKFQS